MTPVRHTQPLTDEGSAVLQFGPQMRSAVADIRHSYLRDRSVFLPGAEVGSLLAQMGVEEDELDALAAVSAALTSDPTLPFRRTRNGRYCLDAGAGKVYRTEQQPFVLSAEEDFVRHDSGMVRVFDEIERDLQDNLGFQGLLAIKAMVVSDVKVEERPGLDYSSSVDVCTVFSIRTTTSAELLGEPAQEGVHSDGVDHTMTTLLGSHNMTDDSARTLILDPAAENGVPWDSVHPSLQVDQVRHADFLDTLLFADHELKHSVSPVFAVDPEEPATRDMAIFFTRKPAMPGHVSHPHDSLAAHGTLGLQLDVPIGQGARS